MTLVIDASVALKLFMDEEGSAEAAELLARNEWLIAPDLITAELANAFWRVQRAGKMTLDQQRDAMPRVTALLSEVLPLRPLATMAMTMARVLNHPAYDCFYLSLAEQRNATFVTADRRFIAWVAGSEWAKRVVALH